MSGVGFLGMGKIGRALAAEVTRLGHEVAFVYDPFLKEPSELPQVTSLDDPRCAKASLVVECATADALKQGFDQIIAHSNLLVFSLTAFSDADFAAHAKAEAQRLGRHIYFPHGAILGLDGIWDGRELLTSVSIETTKSPASLGLSLTEKTVVFEGPTRAACAAFPRNVNVHAAVALAGIGFDKTQSRIVADPSVHTNTHRIQAEGEGIHIELLISSFTTGGVTGIYTPKSACGSLARALSATDTFAFV